ncbi:outer membrane beta-barrel protein [Solitalea canadensis]|uniref:Outer membrane protein beta-barrel domain-containing protein n=1 Tax=Solitalea canadensis (strain ATCC 29591 / DSM 3403 / JCM 21819 / LMG 8368 / NBRC 15130 / NCIMB 12057 / USAM 9D) TaxID=929556 RepID=H8KVR5_SOLCM|nr:hypothetical protein [Solitalea canadensis]AFD06688.1 hypothetical protein Solca_1621 [Solitalea canadensis DSM 3403]
MKFKFVFAILVTLIAVSAQVKAQSTSFIKGDKALNLGIGLGSTGFSGSGYNMSVPPVSVSLEFGIKDNLFNDSKCALGVAPYIGYASYNYAYDYGMANNGKTKLTDLIIGVNGNIHYEFVNKLDTYAGLMLGYENVSWKDSSFGSIAGSGMFVGVNIGGRYYFTDNLAAMMEIGYGVTYLNLGVAFKL